jgi:hypothetical protein
MKIIATHAKLAVSQNTTHAKLAVLQNTKFCDTAS